MARMLRYHRPKKLAKAVVTEAQESIKQHDLESIFVSAKRAKAKVSKLNPTPRQAKLLRWVWQRNITFEESIGTNWSVLGPLMTRGYLRLVKERDGKTYLRVYDVLLPYVSEAFESRTMN